MKFALLLSSLALFLLPGCAKEREGNGVNIHPDLGRRYWEVPHTREYTESHSRYAK